MNQQRPQKKNYLSILAALMLCAVLTQNVHAATSVELRVLGCNNNNSCEANIGENTDNCSNDCPAPVPPVSTGGGVVGSPTSALTIYDIVLQPSSNSIVIHWKTSRVAVGTLVWGLTRDYELGTVSEINYTMDHRVKIENLSPGQRYFFRIDSQDTLQVVVSVRGLEFTTLALPDIEAPANVRNFTAQVRTDSIQLLWNLPLEDDFDTVRIVRTTSGFSQDPFVGKVVYEGKGTYATDTAVVPGTLYYYTLFTKDTSGNYSSGAIVTAFLPKPSKTSVPKPGFGEIPATSTPVIVEPKTEDPFGSLPVTKNPDPKIKALTIVDFDVIQRGDRISFTQSSIKVDERDNVTLAIAYHKLPENLKTIAVTVQDPTDGNKKFTFLLRVNKEKTAYEATIGKFERSGTYPFTVSILDYKTQSVVQLEGAFSVPHDATPKKIEVRTEVAFTEYLVPLIIFVLMVFAVYLIARLIVRLTSRKRRVRLKQR